MIRSNRIFANRGLGIDLQNDGPTANDATDADTGANNLQNYPVITSATIGVSDVQISGTLQSAANQAFEVDFFANLTEDPTGFGQGAQYLGTATVNTGGDGSSQFSVTLPKAAIGTELRPLFSGMSIEELQLAHERCREMRSFSSAR